MLDDELALLTSSLTTGSPIKFDYLTALSGSGNGWYDGGTGGTRRTTGSTLDPGGAAEFGVRRGSEGWDEVEFHERNFGTV